MDRFSDSSRQGWEGAWVKTPGAGRVNVELGIVIICFMEDSSITGAINPYRLSSWLLSTFPTPFPLVILTPTVNTSNEKHSSAAEKENIAVPHHVLLCAPFSARSLTSAQCLCGPCVQHPQRSVAVVEQSQCDADGCACLCPSTVTHSCCKHVKEKALRRAQPITHSCESL